MAYQFAIAGTGVAGAAALLYTAPVMVAVLAKPLLGEALTPTRLLLAVIVMVGGSPPSAGLAWRWWSAEMAGGYLKEVAEQNRS